MKFRPKAYNAIITLTVKLADKQIIEEAQDAKLTTILQGGSAAYPVRH